MFSDLLHRFSYWASQGGNMAALIALVIAVAVPIWQRGTARKDTKKKLRIALREEVLILSSQLEVELKSWNHTVPDGVTTAKFPPLRVFEGNVSNIGLLERDEITTLLRLSGALHDLRVVVTEIENSPRNRGHYPGLSPFVIEPGRASEIRTFLAKGCGISAEFLKAVPEIPTGVLKKRYLDRILELEGKAMDAK
jgi:hypothetical protein